MYATKRRRRNVKNYKHQPKENQKSNPSKRHRERLNGELENLASLLPFEQTILTKLDKLSILRLAVSYLRIKSYFQVSLKQSNYLHIQASQDNSNRNKFSQQLYYLDPNFSEGSAILESLNGFILIANSNSEVFYSSRTVEQYLGFHQSDIIHQSIYELIHSEDRDEFKRQLTWNSSLPADKCDLTLNDLLTKKEYSKYLNRNFTVRFRCLLDNTSGFVTLDIVGHLGVLYGQRYALQLNGNGTDNVQLNGKPCTNKSSKHLKVLNNSNQNVANGGSSTNGSNCINEMDNEQPIIALFAVACPFGPPSLFELPTREALFKTKHKVNLAPLSLDSRGKLLLGYSDQDLNKIGGYDLIHPDDLKYYCNAHKELLKTGSAGLVCYRLMTKNESWQWLQSSMRIIYKSNKPECIIANHRPLTSEEGEELYYKRGVEFKLPYPCLYDFEANFGGLLNNYTSDDLRHPSSIIPNKQQVNPMRQNMSSIKTEINSYPTTTSHSIQQQPIQKTTKPKAKQRQTKTTTQPIQMQHTNEYQQNMFDPTAQMSISNDYAHMSTDYGHHPYNGYFNTLSGYNYSSYISDPNKLYNTAAAATAYPNGFLYQNTSHSNENSNMMNTTNWFESTTNNNFASSKLLPNNYQLLTNTNYQFTNTVINTSNTTPINTQSNYTDLFHCANVKYPNSSYLAEDYSNPLPQFVPNTTYDYNLLNKYNNTINTSKSPTFNVLPQADINNNKNITKDKSLLIKSNILSTPSTSSSSSSSSSTSPATSHEKTQYSTSTTNILDVKQQTNYKKFDNEKQHNHIIDRNSLSSYSTCSSASSSVSNYCSDENSKFIKQENCVVDLPILNPNNIRSGFIKDYYSDMSNYYQNDVNI